MLQSLEQSKIVAHFCRHFTNAKEMINSIYLGQHIQMYHNDLLAVVKAPKKKQRIP